MHGRTPAPAAGSAGQAHPISLHGILTSSPTANRSEMASNRHRGGTLVLP
jgi:hypothetical protein